MIRVYADLECGARCIMFKDEQAPELLELVRAFDDEEREAAWALLHELGHMFTRTPRPAGTPADRARSAAATYAPQPHARVGRRTDARPTR
jgi:hypothetical protein